MNTTMSSKKAELVSVVENAFNKVVLEIKDDSHLNSTYPEYENAFKALREAADDVIRFNLFVADYFSTKEG